jgi:O-antigen/teichoic acid export membrane protein
MTLLRIMALSGIFVSINSIYGSLFKIKNRIMGIFIASTINAIIILGGSFILIKLGYGLKGIAIAYVCGQAITSISYWLMNVNK